MLEIACDGAPFADGVVIDYDAYPLYESPNTRATLDAGKVIFPKMARKADTVLRDRYEKMSIPIQVIS